MRNFVSYISIGLGLLLSVSLQSCSNGKAQKEQGIKQIAQNKTANHQSFKINAQGTTIRNRFTNLDSRYERRATNDYGTWLLNQALRPVGYNTHYYNGIEKYNKCQTGVLKFDFIGKDLQQCADACIRIRAEYLWSKKQYDKIHFKNTPGFNIEYRKWAEGYRVHFDKKWNASWSKDAKQDYSYANFKKYLYFVFTYCGTLSLSKEMQTINLSEIQPGDLLINGGSPGHAVTVLDVLHEKNGNGIKLMLCQSYMPAQEIEILANPYAWNSPWFEIRDAYNPPTVIETPEWDFEGNCVMRWEDL